MSLRAKLQARMLDKANELERSAEDDEKYAAICHFTESGMYLESARQKREQAAAIRTAATSETI